MWMIKESEENTKTVSAKERKKKDCLRYRWLINRYVDNQSGFMVTTDYQVVQGSIFHIATLPYSDSEYLFQASVSMWAYPRHYHHASFFGCSLLIPIGGVLLKKVPNVFSSYGFVCYIHHHIFYSYSNLS